MISAILACKIREVTCLCLTESAVPLRHVLNRADAHREREREREREKERERERERVARALGGNPSCGSAGKYEKLKVWALF